MADDSVIGVIDRSTDVPRFVLADEEREGAWLAVPEGEAYGLEDWR